MELEQNNNQQLPEVPTTGEPQKKGYDASMSIALGGNNASDINQHVKETGLEPFLRTKADFIKTSGIDPKLAAKMYDNNVVPEFARYVSGKYDPWSTNKQYFPNNNVFASLGMPMWNNKTAQVVPIPNKYSLINGKLSNPYEYTSQDRIAEDRGEFKDKRGNWTPMSATKEGGYNDLKFVEGKDDANGYWEEMSSAYEPSDGKIIRSSYGPRDAVTDGWSSAHAWDFAIQAAKSGYGSLMSHINNLISEPSYLKDIKSPSGRIKWTGAESNTEKAINYFNETNPNATDEEKRIFRSSLKGTEAGSAWATYAKRNQIANYDEMGLDSASGWNQNLWTTVGQMFPVMMSALATKGASVASSMGMMTRKTLLNVASTNMEAGMIAMSLEAGGATTQMLKDWGMGHNEALAYGSAFGLVEYLTEKTLSANILYKMGLGNFDKTVRDFTEAELKLYAKANGFGSIKSIPSEVKVKILDRAISKVRGLSSSIENLADKGFWGRIAAGSSEEFIEEGILTNIYGMPIKGWFNLTNKATANKTKDAYEGTKWDEDENGFFKVNSTGIKSYIDEDEWIAEQKDYSMANDIINGTTPLDGGESWWKEGLLGGLAGGVMATPMSAMELFKKKRTEKTAIAKLIFGIQEGNYSMQDVFDSIDANQFGYTGVDTDGKLVSTPKSKVNQEELDAKFEEIKMKYEATLEKANTPEEEKQAADAYQQEMDAVRKEQEASPDQVSIDEATKLGLKETIKYNLQLAEKYKNLNENQLALFSENAHIAGETLKYYDKLEKINNAIKEFNEKGAVETELENLVGKYSVKKDSTLQQLMMTKDFIMREINKRVSPQKDNGHSVRYDELMQESVVFDEKVKVLAELEVDMKAKSDNKVLTPEERDNEVNKKLKKYEDRGIGDSAFISAYMEMHNFKSPMNLYHTINEKVFGKNKYSHLGKYIESVNQKRKQKQEDTNNLVGTVNETIDMLTESIADIGAEGSFSKRYSRSNKVKNATKIKENIKKIMSTSIISISDDLNKSLESLSQLQEQYNKARELALKSIPAENEDEMGDFDSSALGSQLSEAIENAFEYSSVEGNTSPLEDEMTFDNITEQDYEKVATEALKGYLNDNAFGGFRNHLEAIRENIDVLPNPLLSLKSINDIEKEINRLSDFLDTNYRILNKRMLGDQNLKKHSRLRNSTLEKITDKTYQEISDEISSLKDIINEVQPNLKEKSLSRGMTNHKINLIHSELELNSFRDIFDLLHTELKDSDKEAKDLLYKVEAKYNAIFELIKKKHGDNASLITLMDTLNTTTDAQVMEGIKLISDTLRLAMIDLKDSFSSLNQDGMLDRLLIKIKEDASKKGFDYSYNHFLYKSPINENDPSKSDCLKSYNTDLNNYRAFVMINTINAFKDLGLTKPDKDGNPIKRKTLKEIYQGIYDITKKRSAEKDNVNNVMTFAQEMVLIQMYLNRERGPVARKDNPCVDDQYFTDENAIEGFDWSFIISGEPGTGKTTTLMQDYWALVSQLSGKKINVSVISPTQALAETYKKNKDLVNDYIDEDGFQLMTLNSLKDVNTESDILIIDEYSAVSFYRMFNKENGISKYVKSFKGQIIFLGDESQVSHETHDPFDLSKSLSEYQSVTNSTHTAAYFLGERNQMSMTEPFRNGTIKHLDLEKFINTVKGTIKDLVVKYNGSPLKELWGYKESDPTTKFGFKFTKEGGVTIKNNPVYDDYIETYAKLKDNSLKDIQLIVKNDAQKSAFKDYISNKEKNLDDVMINKLMANVKTALLEDGKEENFSSGLDSWNVFVYIPATNLSEINGTDMRYLSKLLKAPSSRVMTNGYMHMYIPIANDLVEYLDLKDLVKGTDALPMFEDYNVNRQERRDEYLEFLKKVTGAQTATSNTANSGTTEEQEQAEETTEEPKTAKDKKMVAESHLALTDEQQFMIANNAQFIALEAKYNQIVRDYTKDIINNKDNKDSVRDLYDRLIFLREVYTNYLNADINAEQLKSINDQIQVLQDLYNSLIPENERAVKGLENNVARAIIKSFNLSNVLSRRTLIPHVTLSDGHSIAFLDVVGMKDGKMIVDYYFVNTIMHTKNKSNKNEYDREIDKAILLLQENPNLILRDINEIGIERSREGSSDVFERNTKAISTTKIKSLKSAKGVVLAKPKDMWGVIGVDDNGDPVQTVREEHISGSKYERKMHEGKAIRKDAYIYMMNSKGELVKSIRYIDSFGVPGIISEEDYNKLTDEKSEPNYFIEGANLNEKGMRVTTTHIIPLAIETPIEDVNITNYFEKIAKNNDSFININSAYGRLKMFIVNNLDNVKISKHSYIGPSKFGDKKEGTKTFGVVFYNRLHNYVNESNLTELYDRCADIIKESGSNYKLEKTIKGVSEFMSKTYLDVLSTDFLPEYNYGKTKPGEDRLTDEEIIIFIENKDAKKSEEVLAKINFTREGQDEENKANNAYNKQRLNDLRNIHSNQGQLYEIKEIRMGAAVSINKKKDKNPIKTIQENLAKIYGIETADDGVITMGYNKAKSRVVFIVKLSDKKGIVKSIEVKLDAKAITKDEVKALIKQTEEQIKEVEDIIKQINSLDKEKDKEERKRLASEAFGIINKKDFMKFIDANMSNFFNNSSELRERANSFVSISKTGYTNLKKGTIKQKMQAAKMLLTILHSDMVAEKITNEFYNYIELQEGVGQVPASEITKLEARNGVDSFNAPQVLISNSVVQSTTETSEAPTEEETKPKITREVKRKKSIRNFESLNDINDIVFSANTDYVNKVIANLLGSKKAKALNLQLKDFSFDNAHQYGKFILAINSLGQRTYSIALKDINGQYSESILRHEIMHYIVDTILTSNQRNALYDEVATILSKNGIEVTDKNINEYIADAFMYKSKLPPQNILSRVIAMIKLFASKLLDVNLTLSETLYLADEGMFKFLDNSNDEVDEYIERNKDVSSNLNDEEAIAYMNQQMIDENNIRLFTDKYIPAYFRMNSPFSSLIDRNSFTVKDVIETISNDIKNERDEIIKDRLENNKTANVIDITDKEYGNLSRKDKDDAIFIRVANDDRLLNILLQQVFTDFDIIEVLKENKEASGGAAHTGFNENDRNNPELLKTTLYKLVLSTIPRANFQRWKKDESDPYYDYHRDFVFSNYVENVLHNVTSRLREKYVRITKKEFINELKNLMYEYSEGVMKDAALSLYIELGDYKQDAGNINSDNAADVQRGLYYFVNNTETTAREMSTHDVDGVNTFNEDDYKSNLEFLNNKAKFVNNLLSKIFTTMISQTENVVMFSDFSNNKNVAVKVSGSDVAINLERTKRELVNNLFDEDMRLSQNIHNDFVGKNRIYNVDINGISKKNEEGKFVEFLSPANDKETNIEAISELMAYFKINLSKEFLVTMANKDFDRLLDYTKKIVSRTYMLIDAENFFDELVGKEKTTDKQYIKEKKRLEDEIKANPNNDINISNNNEEVKRDLKKLDDAFNKSTISLFFRQYKKKQSPRIKLLSDYVDTEGLNHYYSFISSENNYVPTPLDDNSLFTWISSLMIALDPNAKNQKIRTPKGEATSQYSRISPLYNLLSHGNNNTSRLEGSRNNRIKNAIDEMIFEAQASNTLNRNMALSENLFYNGLLDFDIMTSMIGAKNEDNGEDAGGISTQDFLKTWIDVLLVDELSKGTGISKLPVFLDNFSDKTKVPYIDLFDSVNMRSVFDFEMSDKKVSSIKLKEDIIIKSFDQAVSWYRNRQQKSIETLKSIDETIDPLNITTEQGLKLMNDTRAIVHRDYNFKKENGKYTFSPGYAITLSHKKNNSSIYNEGFINAYSQLSTNAEKIKLIDDVIEQDLRGFGKIIVESGYRLPFMFSRMHNGIVREVNGRKELVSFERLTETNKAIYDQLTREAVDRHNTDPNSTYSIIYDDKYDFSTKMAIQRELLKTDKTLKRKLKAAKKENRAVEESYLTDNDYMIEVMNKNGDGTETIFHPLLKLLYMGFHISNTQLQQLYKGDEYFYKDVTDMMKRASGDVSPIDLADTEVKYGISDTMRFITIEDIEGFHRFLPNNPDLELYTNGFSWMTPWMRVQMKVSYGGELGSISDGVLKTTMKQYNPATDELTYLKFAQGLITKWEHDNSQFIKLLTKACLTSVADNVMVNGQPINLYEKWLSLVANNWTEGNKKFNEFLWTNDDDGVLINDYVVGFVTAASGFKSGLRGINRLGETADKQLEFFDPNISYSEVSTRNYGLQLLKEHPVASSDKSIATQNIRLLGISIANKNYASTINTALEKILDVFLDEIDSATTRGGQFDIDAAISYIRDISSKKKIGKEVSNKMKMLLQSDVISIDILKEKHIQHLITYVNTYMKPFMTGGTYVQAPTMIRFYVDKSGIFRTKTELGEENDGDTMLGPEEFFSIDNDNNYTSLKKDELAEIVRKNAEDPENVTPIKIKPADAIMEFHKRSYFGISKNTELYDLMNIEVIGENKKSSISMFDSWKKETTLKERKDILANYYQDAEIATIINSLHSDVRYMIAKNVESKGIVLESLYTSKDLAKKYDTVISSIAEYYQELNKALWVFTDRIPHSGFNSGQISRIVAFAHGVENTIYLSPEKSVLDGSDYDIDEIHAFFHTINKLDKVKEEDIVKDENMQDQENILFDMIKQTYLNPNNISLMTMMIDIQSLRDKASLLDDKNQYVFNSLTAKIKKAESGFAGKELVGFMVDIGNSVSSLITQVNAIGIETLLSKESVLGGTYRLLEGNERYIMQFVDLVQKLINAATDNSKEDGILGKLGINKGNTSILTGLMLSMNIEEDDEINKSINSNIYSMEEYVFAMFNSDINMRASKLFLNDASISSNSYSSYYMNLGKAKSEIAREVIDEYKERIKSIPELSIEESNQIKETLIAERKTKIDTIEQEYEILKKAFNIGTAVRRYYSFDMLNGIKKPNEWLLYNTADNMERNLGMSLNDFSIKASNLESTYFNNYNISERIKYLTNEKGLNSTDKTAEEAIMKVMNIPYLVFSNNKFKNYIKTMNKTKELVNNSFVIHNQNIEDKFKEIQKVNRFKNETIYNEYLKEKEKALVGYFIDTLPAISFNGVKYDMSNPSDRSRFIYQTENIYLHLKETYPTNDLVSLLKTYRRYEKFPVLQIRNSKSYPSEMKNSIAKEFSKLSEQDKDLLRYISVILNGFKAFNGSITEYIDDALELKFSNTKSSFADKFEKNLDSVIKMMAINNDYLQNKNYQLFDEQVEDKTSKGTIVYRESLSGDRKHLFMIENNKPIGVSNPYDLRINNYSENSLISKEKPFKYFDYKQLNDIAKLDIGESVSYRKPEYIKLAKPTMDTKSTPQWVKDGDKVIMPNGIIGKISVGTVSGIEMINFTKEALFNEPETTSTEITRNVPNILTNRIAGNMIVEVVSRIQMMFPNVKINFVSNITSQDRSAAAYIFNGQLYINTDNFSVDTPIHEMAHIVVELIRTLDVSTYERLREEAIALIDSNQELRNYLDKHYSHLSKEDRISEAMALTIGWNSADAVDTFLMKIGADKTKATTIWNRISQLIKDAYNSFFSILNNVLFGDNVNVSNIDVSNMTLSGLSDALVDSFMNNKQISNVSSSSLNKIMAAGSNNTSLIRKNITEAKGLGELIPLMHGTINKTSFLEGLEKDDMINNIYNNAKKNKGFVHISPRGYNLNTIDITGKDEATEWKNYIEKVILPDLSIFKNMYTETLLDWLNEGADIEKLETFGVTKDMGYSIQYFKKFLRAINYDPTTRYVRYSDLEKEEWFKGSYNAIASGFNPIVAISKSEGKVVLSIYDVSPSLYEYSNTVEKRRNLLSNYISDIKAKVLGVTMKNNIVDVKQLFLKLLINDITKKNGNVSIMTASVIEMDPNKANVHMMDNAMLNQNVKGIAASKEFMNTLSPEVRELFENSNYNFHVDYLDFMRNFYLTHEEKVEDKWLKENKKYIYNDDFDLNESKFFITSRMKYLYEQDKQYALSQQHTNELIGLKQLYKQLFTVNQDSYSTNRIDITDNVEGLVTPTQNIAQPEFMFMRDVITQASNEIVYEVQQLKEKLQGSKKNPGIIRKLQENYAKRNDIHDFEKFISYNEHKVYEDMYATVEDKNGVKRKIGFILWSTSEEELFKAGYSKQQAREFASQAKERFGNNQEVLDEAKKINDFVKDLLVKRIQHDYQQRSYYQLSYKDAEKRLSTHSTYKYGMIPMMNKKSAESFYKNFNIKGSVTKSADEFVRGFTTYETSFAEQRNSLKIIEEINDVFIHQFEYSHNSKPDDVSMTNTEYGSENKLSKMFGLSVEHIITNEKDEHGNAITKISFNSDETTDELADNLSSNLQTSLLYFMLTGVRKQKYEEDVIPVLNGTLLMMKDAATNKDIFEYQDENISKLIRMYSDRVIHGKNTLDAKKTQLDTWYNTMNRVLTPMVMFLNPKIAMVSVMSNTINAFYSSLASTIVPDGEPTIAEQHKAFMQVINNFDRAVEWAYKYQVINATELETITSRFRGVVGEKYIFNKFVSSLLNWGADSFSRVQSMVAIMIHDGSWDAHGFDKKTGVATYDEKIDKQFVGDDGKIRKEFYAKQLSIEQGLNEDGSFNRGYFWKAAKYFKTYSDSKIMGSYSAEVRELASMHFLGKWFGKFGTWLYGMGDLMFGKEKYLTEGGRVIIKEINGVKTASFEQACFEGMARTTFKLLRDMVILRDVSQWDKLNDRKKNNVVKMGIMVSMLLLVTAMIKYGLDDDDEKDIKDQAFAGEAYRAFLQTMRSSMVLPEIIAKLQHPFALFGIAERTANNLFRSFINKDGQVEFDYSKIKKVVPSLRTFEYVGIDDGEE